MGVDNMGCLDKQKAKEGVGSSKLKSWVMTEPSQKFDFTCRMELSAPLTSTLDLEWNLAEQEVVAEI